MAKKQQATQGKPTVESLFGGSMSDEVREFYKVHSSGHWGTKQGQCWHLCYAIKNGIGKALLAERALQRIVRPFCDSDFHLKRNGELLQESIDMLSGKKHKPLYTADGMSLANGRLQDYKGINPKTCKAALLPCVDEYCKVIAYPAAIQYCADAQIKEPPTEEEFKKNLVAWLNE